MVDLLALVGELWKDLTGQLFPGAQRRCSRTKELAITINCLYESYNLNRYWSQAPAGKQEIVSEQLKGISEVMASLPGNWSMSWRPGI